MTGHAFAAGYDIRTKETYEATMKSFGEIVGFQYLRGMHLNDSQGGGLNCKKDRHENIGLGEIGFAAFRHLVRDPRTAGIPLVLETPNFDETLVWRREIELLYELQDMEGDEEEVEEKLKVMKEKWKVEVEEIRKKMGKEAKAKPERKPAAAKKGTAKGVKGKAAAKAEAESEEEGSLSEEGEEEDGAETDSKPPTKQLAKRIRGGAYESDDEDDFELTGGSVLSASEPETTTQQPKGRKRRAAKMDDEEAEVLLMQNAAAKATKSKTKLATKAALTRAKKAKQTSILQMMGGVESESEGQVELQG